MNGLTYFRLKSQYKGDITKDCALNGYEVDNNFQTLEGRDIKSITVEDNDLVITLLNGNTLKAKDAIQDSVNDIEFDNVNGVLRVTINGKVKEIGGFVSELNISPDTIAVGAKVDDTLKGNGLAGTPIGVSSLAKTGQYKPVESFIDLTICGNKLPKKESLVPGERFVTKENVSDYGFLYDYKAITKIACDLHHSHSAWRIPTKEDWDDMLNAIEPCDQDKNHDSATGNKHLGKWAGKLLKSVDLWHIDDSKPCDEDFNEGETCIDYDNTKPENSGCHCSCGKRVKCAPKFCGEYGHCHHRPKHIHEGLDKYGFRVTPAGYADDGENFVYFKDRASFWTASNAKGVSAYVKRFEYDSSRVHQDIIASQNHLSLRLVKDFTGNNYNEREDILGNSYTTVLMPSVKNGQSIWTSVNFSNSNCCYHPLAPNDGQNLTYTTVYFINEWDGHKWLRNEVKEGESVVIKNAPRNKTNVEYRVVNGEFKNVMDAVYAEVKEAVDNDIQVVVNTIENEIERAVAKDEELTQSINEINESLTEFKTESLTKFEELDNEIVDLKAKDEVLDAAIKEETERTNNMVNQLNENITTIVNQINQNVADGFNALNTEIGKTNTALSEEVVNRVTSDEQLQQNINDTNEHLDNVEDKLEQLTETEREHNEERLAKEAELDAKDEEIEGKLLTQEGTSFNKETGVLTLKSDKGTNDIEIQFTASFGTF